MSPSVAFCGKLPSCEGRGGDPPEPGAGVGGDGRGVRRDGDGPHREGSARPGHGGPHPAPQEGPVVSGALAGLRVADCSRLIAGGVLAPLLADHGADVVKVENPRGGDPLRTWLRERGELWWKVYARGKRSVTLNLTNPRGQDLLKRLIRDADVFIENFVPGTLEKWGLGPDVLLGLNRRLIVARVSGW